MTFKYENEMSNEEHIQLVELLLKIKGKAILSGYEHEIYNQLIKNNWKKIFLGEYDKKSIKATDVVRERGKEFVWINYDIKDK